MLEVGHTRTVTEESWNRLPSRVQLPVDPEEFFAPRGPLPVHPESRRLGFYSPIQLFPCDTVVVLMPEKEPIQAEVTRCLRIGDACYEIGTVFARTRDDVRS